MVALLTCRWQLPPGQSRADPLNESFRVEAHTQIIPPFFRVFTIFIGRGWSGAVRSGSNGRRLVLDGAITRDQRNDSCDSDLSA